MKPFHEDEIEVNLTDDHIVIDCQQNEDGVCPAKVVFEHPFPEDGDHDATEYSFSSEDELKINIPIKKKAVYDIDAHICTDAKNSCCLSTVERMLDL
ncbi:hypothetical protein CEXT_134591 [Caerostris extrusa]|uniref:Uncharacterized protein n=1 Tax=Caerostris extrusa TaxID=172846 RepID=A0AAV4X0X7_CAEEX|nr:hypothetical protein CEXT_134591 [Caerostris extrusa]